MTKARKQKPPRLAVSDAEWAEAMRREAVIRPLIAQVRLGRPVMARASRTLGISTPRIYALLRSFRDDPVTASLLTRRPGPAKGSRLLSTPLEDRIEAAIEAVYLQPERPTVKRVWMEVRRSCHAAGLQPPSLKALRARVSARTLRERVKAREGAAAADNQFRQVRIGLRPERPLHLVQIDHTKVDIMLVDDVTRACIGRPWLTLVLDVHTRMVAGIYLSLDPPNATFAALAVDRLVRWPACSM